MASDAAAQVTARLKALRVKAATTAPREAAQAMALTAVTATQLELSRTSHAKRTPTPSRPGEPPSLITGTLRRSVTFTPPVPEGPGRWVATIGGTVIYARVQELGGSTGRNHATSLPPRPYLRPATEKLSSSGTLTAVAAKSFLAALY